MTKRQVLKVYLGNSGSGKDFMADVHIKDKRGTWKIHPVSEWKRFLENVWNIPAGFLDEADFKHQYIPGTSVTYQQYMVKMWEAHKELGVSIAVPMLANRINEWLDHGDGADAVLTGIRTLEEAMVVIEEAGYRDDVDIQVVVVYNRGRPETSDAELADIIGTFATKLGGVYFIDNKMDAFRNEQD